MRRLSGKLVSFIIVGVAVSLVGIVTAADAVTSPPTADMAVTSMRASVTSATHGSVITFTEVIRNNGPETVEMDAQPQISGGVLVTETCDLGISRIRHSLRVRVHRRPDQPDHEIPSASDRDPWCRGRQGWRVDRGA